MNKIIEIVMKVVIGLSVLICGFFVGWILRAVKAKRQLKTQKEHYTKK